MALNPDLFVSPSQSLTQRDFRFPESMGAQLRAIPGVGEVQLVRDARIEIQGKPTMFVAVDIGESQEDMPRCRQWPAIPTTCSAAAEQGKGRAGFGKLRAAARIQTGRRGGYSQPQRRAAFADRRHRHRLFRRAGQLAGGSRAVQTLLERQHGEYIPHLSRAGRGGGRCEAADSGTVRQSAAAVCAHQSRSAPLHPAIDRSMVRHHLCADRSGGFGGQCSASSTR